MVCFPALITAGVPFVRIVSCNPLEIKGPDIPPAFSGYCRPPTGRLGTRSAPSTTARTGRLWEAFNAWVTGRARRRCPTWSSSTLATSTSTSIPELIDYTDARPLTPSWHRLDSSVRETDERSTLPEFAERRRRR